VPLANNQGAVLYYTQTLNNGNISPETAFGLDLGVDHRINDDLIFSGDIYQTALHGQFLNTTSVDGTYTPASGPNAGKTRPLYITKTANLGQSRYQGLELTLRRVPETGFGFKAQGALIRAYTYNLPPGFWDTANGPNTTNLAVIPNANFYGSGNGYNGIADGNVPYAQGYAEANYRTRTGGLFLLGATYYGNNNSYNAPAFFVVSASARVSINDHVSVQLTGDNLTDSLGEKTANLFGGKPVPLVNGTVGVTTAFNVGPPTAHFIVHITTGP
jgi:outer membrane receptor protein involved in Fe transport